MPATTVSPAQAHFITAERHFKVREYQEALRVLTRGFQADYNHKPLYYLAKETLNKLGGDQERRLFAVALLEFEAFQSFFDLGYHFVEVGHYDLASAFLEKALTIEPNNLDAAYELAFALMARFKIERALSVLEKVNYHHDFWVAYLFYQCRLWTNQLEGVQDFIDDARALLDEQGKEEGSELAYEKINELQASLQRYTAVGKPELQIRDWHFIQYGAAILSYFETADEYVAGGRYVALWGGYSLIKENLLRLVEYLTLMERLPQRVLAVPERNSEVIAYALAELLNVPYELLETAQDFQHCLIVGANNTTFNGIEPLINIDNGQTVFALQQNWFELSMITPDVVGFVAQYYTFPWEEEHPSPPATIEQVTAELSIEELAAHILLAEVTEPNEDDFVANCAFYQRVQPWLKGQEKGGTQRAPYSVESPVAGSYFGS